MPITEFQRRVLGLIKINRNPESYVAGGTALNRHPDSMRFSADVDIFHDADLAVVRGFEADRDQLVKAGFSVEIHIAQPSFYRATVAKGADQVKLEWVRDTAFRFFPVIEDDNLGYRLHDIDLVINKCLALANRSEVRDAIDILEADRQLLSLPMTITAACGKDPGFTPALMLEMIQRHITFTPAAVAIEALARPLDAKWLKKKLLSLLERTRTTLAHVRAEDIGVIFINGDGRVIKSFEELKDQKVTRHMGSVKGSWPRIVPKILESM